jgi:hypothetical protein
MMVAFVRRWPRATTWMLVVAVLAWHVHRYETADVWWMNPWP